MADKLQNVVPADCETSGLESSQAVDFSCIHWGYLNCVHVTDSGKKGKAHSWQTCWVDLCGSTLRLYRDLSLSPDSAIYPPSPSVIGPTDECQKKEAFIILRKDAEVDIIDYEEELYKPRKKGRREILRNHVFKLCLAGKGLGSLAYLFQAPSKSSLYRWISKIEEGIEHADKPLTESVTVSSSLTSAFKFLRGFSMHKKLKKAKLLAMEQRRYQVPSEQMRYTDNREDIDSGMEGDVEENVPSPQPVPSNPKLEHLRQLLKQREELLELLEQGERDFTGGAPDNPCLSKVCQFQATTKGDYVLIQGFPASFMAKATMLTVFGQLPNGRWRCCVELPVSKEEYESEDSAVSSRNSSSTSLAADKVSRAPGDLESLSDKADKRTELFIGSVPSSLLVELENMFQQLEGKDIPRTDVIEDGTPTESPDLTPRQLSPSPSPPGSPYSPHKATERRPPGEKKPTQSHWKPFAEGNHCEKSILEHVRFPSPPSSPSSVVSSGSSSTSGSLEGSAERLEDPLDRVSVQVAEADRPGEGSGDDVPVTYIGSESEDDRQLTVIDESREQCEKGDDGTDTVKRRPKPTYLMPPSAAAGSPKSYAFHVTRKLRQRGISLIVGSSSSEDEDDSPRISSGRSSQISKGKLDKEFRQFERQDQRSQTVVRPYSTAFAPSGQKIGISLHPPQTYPPRSATTDELLRDYSCESAKKSLTRSSTCTTLSTAARWSVPLVAPPLNQRRTLQLEKKDEGGFGFTLQTYGIIQCEGHVEYMTFVLDVQEDGPAYLAGLRPGDIVIEIGGQLVEEADHKTLVKLIQEAPASVRIVAVFVDAIRKMKINTKLKILKAKLEEKETEFDELSKQEQDLLKGCGGDSLVLPEADISQRRGRTNSYLYTTELTSRFSKDDAKVQEHTRQYRQEGPDRARRISLPDVSDLDKQEILVTTTSNQMLRTFASNESFFKKASSKLQKSIKKRRPTSKSFTSYLVDFGVSPGSAGQDIAGSKSSSLRSVNGDTGKRLSQSSPRLTVQEHSPKAKAPNTKEAKEQRSSGNAEHSSNAKSTNTKEAKGQRSSGNAGKLSAVNKSTEPNLKTKKSDSGSDSAKPEAQTREVHPLLTLSESKTESQVLISKTSANEEETKANCELSKQRGHDLETHPSVAESEVWIPVNITKNEPSFPADEAICSPGEALTSTGSEEPRLDEAAKKSVDETERSRGLLSSSGSFTANEKSRGICRNVSAGIDLHKGEEGKQIQGKCETAIQSAKIETRPKSLVVVQTGEEIPVHCLASPTNECPSVESGIAQGGRDAGASDADRKQSSPKSWPRETTVTEISQLLRADVGERVPTQGGVSQSPDRREENLVKTRPEILEKPFGETQSQTISKGSAQAASRLGSNIAQMRSRFENPSSAQPARVTMKPSPKPLKTRQCKPPAQ